MSLLPKELENIGHHIRCNDACFRLPVAFFLFSLLSVTSWAGGANSNAVVEADSAYQKITAELSKSGQRNVKEAQRNLCAVPEIDITKSIALTRDTEVHAQCARFERDPADLGNLSNYLKSMSFEQLKKLAREEKNQREVDFIKFYKSKNRSNIASELSIDALMATLEQYKKAHNEVLETSAKATGTLKTLDGAQKNLAAIAEGKTPTMSEEEKLNLLNPLSNSLNELEAQGADTTNELHLLEEQLSLLKKQKAGATAYSPYLQEIKLYKNQQLVTNSKIARMKTLIAYVKSPKAGMNVKPAAKEAFDSFVSQIEIAKSQASEKGDYYLSVIKNFESMIAAKQNLPKPVDLSLLRNPNAKSKEDELRELELAVRKDSRLSQIEQRPGFQKCGLSVAEELAIVWYCGDGYGSLNSALRSTDPVTVEKFKPFKDTLNSALNKLAKFNGYTIRGSDLPPSVRDQHVPGNVVNYSAFTSTSLTSGFAGSDVFVIKSKTGHFVGTYSPSQSENEVLFASDTQFKILSVKQSNMSGTREYVLEEVIK